jgi:hypothetical protein
VLSFEDNVNLAVVHQLSADTASSRAAFVRALSQADERSLRRLPPDLSTFYFVQLANVFGMAAERPEIIALARSLLPPDLEAQTRTPSPSR